MNLVENFSRTSSDMAEVCDRASFFIHEPLKGIVEEFVADIRLYGDSERAFVKIGKKLKGCKLAEIFKSFEVCQRHEGNFADIVRDAKKSVREFDKSMTVRRAIVASARGDLAALVGAGIMVFMMLNDFLSKGVWEILTGSYIGIGILVYCGICLLLILWVMIKGD
jgi:hypothetical protein